MADLDGNFTLNANKGDVIVVSYIGYKTQELKAVSGKRMEIKLVPDSQALEEVVVVGYGAMKRSDLTGSVSSIAAKDLEDFKSSSVMEALGGQVAVYRLLNLTVLRVQVSVSTSVVWEL